MKTYSMLNDLAFQWIFNQPGHEKILRSLLNALLHLEGADRIAEIHYLNPFNPARFVDSRKSVVDIKVRDEKNNWYEVEAQVWQRKGYIQRTAFYVAGLYAAQAKKGEEFNELTPAISISILGFNLFKESTRVQEVFEFRNTDNSLTLPPTMSLHYIDLTRFNRKKPHELQSPFEKWLHLMKFSKAYARMRLDLTKVFPDEEEMAMALTEHTKLHADEAMRIRMEDRERARIDEILLRNAYLKEGRAEGKIEGKNEKAREIARALKSENMNDEFIMKITGLSHEELKSCLKAD
ncbi:MAG TPA: Rpn family recombination-promoting nuclease/putative transposase [Candidatus Rifleibacterium sp.]|nr:Rpn family recombination-promoting nuclease/putative transposase [Candidatus Rifleibacterium sp.]